MAYLQIEDLQVNYGAIKAVQGVSFSVEQGEIVTLIGANGAGKTSIMNTVAGLIKPAAGTITFGGTDITGRKAYSIVKNGLTLCPEGRKIFPRFTTYENLKMGGYTTTPEVINRGIERAAELFPRLKERFDQVAGTLSGGEQQMLAVGRALMSEPKLLMLDEPSLGLAPIVVQELFECFTKINKEGTTILLVEQNASMALDISHRGYVVENGKINLSGTGKELANNDKVREAYLGGL
ncbi:MAG: ABC transporter ATP-binding protein [Lachnospiraceae bacterium]|nr:ABC transporter ATP-binding protein [Lachnospiraceae bacterium]